MIEIISDHKPTNADKIRGISDRELANFLFELQISLCCPDNIKSDIGFLEWLQRPEE